MEESLLLVCQIKPAGMALFFLTKFLPIGPTIISGFGFNTNQSTLLNMGSGSVQVVGTILALFIAKHTNRTVGGLFPLALAIVGVIMMLAIPEANYGARYGGYILMYQCQSIICIDSSDVNANMRQSLFASFSSYHT